MRSAVKNSDMIQHQLNEKLTSFRAKVSEPLPELSSGPDRDKPGHNQFDVLTREHKVQEWEALHEDCMNMPAQLLLQTIEEIEEFIDRLERIAREVMYILDAIRLATGETVFSLKLGNRGKYHI